MTDLFDPPLASFTLNGNTRVSADFEGNALGTWAAGMGDFAAVASGLGMIAAGGVKTKTIADGTTDLSSDESQGVLFSFAGTLTGNVLVNFVAGWQGLGIVKNNTSGGFTISLGLSGGGRVAIPAGKSALVFCFGTDFELAPDIVTSLTINEGDLTVADNVAIGGSLSVTNDIEAQDIHATGALDVDGAGEVGGTFTATGIATFVDDVSVGGDLSATGTFTAAAAGITGNVDAASFTVTSSGILIEADFIQISDGFYLQKAGDNRTLNFEANSYLNYDVALDVANLAVGAVLRETWG